jgi:hypothetical protein
MFFFPGIDEVACRIIHKRKKKVQYLETDIGCNLRLCKQKRHMPMFLDSQTEETLKLLTLGIFWL